MPDREAAEGQEAQGEAAHRRAEHQQRRLSHRRQPDLLPRPARRRRRSGCRTSSSRSSGSRRSCCRSTRPRAPSTGSRGRCWRRSTRSRPTTGATCRCPPPGRWAGCSSSPPPGSTYGVDANGDGKKDPYNPVDAIFAAARYLRAAGGDKNISKAIFAYNHADWYVQSVMLRAKLIGGMPADLVGSLTGLTEGHFPVAARATYARASTRARGDPAVQRATPRSTVDDNARRRSIDIFARAGAPVVAVNDGVIRRVGTTKRLGRYVVLRGRRTATPTPTRTSAASPPSYPAPKPVQPHGRASCEPSSRRRRATRPPRPAPAQRRATSASGTRRQGAPATSARAGDRGAGQGAAVRPPAPRGNSYRAGGDQQLLGTGTPVAGYATFDDYISKVLGLRRSDVVFKALKPGRAGDRRHDPRPHRPHRPAARAARDLRDQAGGPRRPADRPQADPRRLEAARGHRDLPRRRARTPSGAATPRTPRSARSC